MNETQGGVGGVMARIYISLDPIREDVKPISCGLVRKRGGGGQTHVHKQNRCFFSINREKDAECYCSETEKYAKIFRDIFEYLLSFFLIFS